MNLIQQEVKQATFTGWRRKKTIGLFGATMVETVAGAMASFVTFYAITLIGFRQTWPLLIVLALLGFSLIRLSGTALWVYVYREVSMVVFRRLGFGDFLSPLVVASPGKNLPTLPGPLGPTVTYDIFPDGHEFDKDGNPTSSSAYAVVFNRESRKTTVSWIGNAYTMDLADTDQINGWVSAWSNVLMSFGLTKQLDHANIMITTSNEPGAVVSMNIDDELDAAAPQLSREILQQLSDRETRGTKITKTVVSITFDTRYGIAGNSKDPQVHLEEVHNLVEGFDRQLRSSGLASLRLMKKQDLAAVLRGAFDPDKRLYLSRALHENDQDAFEALRWEKAGPNETYSRRKHFEHDGSISISHVMTDAPKSPVTASILGDLVSPGKYPKTVSFLYTPTPAAQAAATLERQVNAGRFKRAMRGHTKADMTANESHDEHLAVEAAQAQARGAGVGDFTIVVTQTKQLNDPTDEAERNRAIQLMDAEVENKSTAQQLLLRKTTGWHDIAFMTTLPAGIHPAKVLRRVN